MTCLIDLHYLPCIEYFACLAQFETIIIERHEHYEKQSYRNRCHINTAHGFERLVIPVTSKHGKVKLSDVRIDNAQKWVNNHWRTIESAYRKAPFYEHYVDELNASLTKENTFLYDLNFELLTICLNWLNLKMTIKESETHEITLTSDVVDYRNMIHPKKSSQHATYFKPLKYQQVFGKTFVSNLSLIDLIFCEGPNALNFIRSHG